jgi:hypothetical protein
MEYEITLDRTRHRCRVRVTGPLDVSKYESAIEELIDALGDAPNTPTLYDIREADLRHLNADDMRALRLANERLSDRRGAARLAVVVANDVHFGLVRMYEALGATPNLDLRVFRDKDQAERWLDEAGSDAAD